MATVLTIVGMVIVMVLIAFLLQRSAARRKVAQLESARPENEKTPP